MRSSLATLGLALTVLGVSQAKADFRPGRLRPVQKAVVREFDASGHEINNGATKTLRTFRRDGDQHVSVITLTEQHTIFCVTAPCPQPAPRVTTFTVRDIREIGCGSKELVGFEVSPGHHGSIALEDHTKRLCDNYVPFRWVADVHLNGRVRIMKGNPRSEYTTMSTGIAQDVE